MKTAPQSAFLLPPAESLSSCAPLSLSEPLPFSEPLPSRFPLPFPSPLPAEYTSATPAEDFPLSAGLTGEIANKIGILTPAKTPSKTAQNRFRPAAALFNQGQAMYIWQMTKTTNSTPHHRCTCFQKCASAPSKIYPVPLCGPWGIFQAKAIPVAESTHTLIHKRKFKQRRIINLFILNLLSKEHNKSRYCEQHVTHRRIV